MKRVFGFLLAFLLIVSLLPARAQAAGEKLIALTFDDGPHKTNTEQLLDGLKELDATVTFFIVGQSAKSYPDIVKRAYDEGHEIASHTWDHPKLSSLSYNGVQSQVSKTAAQLDKACGAGTKYLLRPPYGSYNSTTKSAVGTPMIYWSVDTNDWKYKNYSHVYNHIIDNAWDGAIILCHDIHATTIPAALDAVRTLQKQGYEFVSVSELFRRKGVEMTNGTVYTKCTGDTVCDKVAAPVITYEPDANGVRITITSPSGAPVYYTTDGSRLTQESAVYSGSFVVSCPVQIQAVAAFNLNGGRSDAATLKLDKLPSFPPKMELTGSAMKLITQSKGASIYYTLDCSVPNGGSTKYTGPVKLEPDTLIRAVTGGGDYAQSKELVMYYSENGNLYADVLPGQWYTKIVDQLVSEGLLLGTGDYKLEPDGTLTRAMLVELLMRYAGQTKDTAAKRINTFTDVADDKWYAASVEWAYANDVVEGYPDGTFRPDQPVTRQEMAEVISGFLEYRGNALAEGEDCRTQFRDGAQISDWALRSMNAVVKAQLMLGDQNGDLHPAASATRAEFATVLLRLRSYEARAQATSGSA